MAWQLMVEVIQHPHAVRYRPLQPLLGFMPQHLPIPFTKV
jgi:hypothetical protein